MTQRQLAESLGVEAITVSRWERGVTVPSLPRLRRIAEITETTVSDLVRAPDAVTGQAAELRQHATEARLRDLRMVYEAGLGHIGGEFSALDILTTLYFGCFASTPTSGRADSISQDHAAAALCSRRGRLFDPAGRTHSWRRSPPQRTPRPGMYPT
jgi:transcriptional regulator with XRE-family HTH domain